jgi:acyl-coenzyme A synthetase/AMP-(fatty) acid ligase/thioesterase domain-containing protein/aryl carrier-like protein
MHWMPVLKKIEAMASSFPQDVVIRQGDRSLTYLELQNRYVGLAAYIQRHGVQPGDRVAMALASPLDSILGYLALFHIGAVVIPMDAADGRDVVEEKLRRLAIPWLLCGSDFKAGTLPTKRINFTEPESTPEKTARQYRDPSPTDLSYIFFTSGSTAKAKAIGGTQEALAHYIGWQSQAFDLTRGMRYSQWIRPTYDAFLRDFLTPLYTGGCLCIPDQDITQWSTRELVRWVAEQNIAVLNTIPGVFRSLASTPLGDPLNDSFTDGDLASLKYIFLAGETLHWRDIQQWLSRHGHNASIVNLYGATETVMTKLFYQVPENSIQNQGVVPIGAPMAGAKAHIVDDTGRALPDGTPGEIQITVPYALPGYIDGDNTGFTITSNKKKPSGSETVFRSGDRGRINERGEMEYLGRMDRQIKYHGRKLDLHQIETELKACYDQGRLAVIGDSQSLFVLLEPSNEHAVKRAQKDLLNHLAAPPLNLLGVRVLTVNPWPRLVSGKTDYSALGRWVKQQANSDYLTGTVYEQGDLLSVELAKMWQSVLEHDQFDRHSRFFDCGGDSLKAMVLLGIFEETFGVTLKVADFIQQPTIDAMKAYLQQNSVYCTPTTVVALNRSRPGPALFFIHPPGGTVVPYAKLAAALDQFAFYGIQYPANYGGCDLYQMEEMAAFYADAILQKKPDGPYFLGGWSSGGLIALQVARRLQQMRNDVPCLFLLDTPMHYRPGLSPQIRRLWTVQSLVRHFAIGMGVNEKMQGAGVARNKRQRLVLSLLAKQLLGIEVDEFDDNDLDYCFDLIEQVMQTKLGRWSWLLNLLPAKAITSLSAEKQVEWFFRLSKPLHNRRFPVDLKTVQEYLAIFRTNMETVMRDKPAKIDSDVYLLSPDRDVDIQGWDAINQTVFPKIIPGNHFTMFHDPHVFSLASIIESTITTYLQNHAYPHAV